MPGNSQLELCFVLKTIPFKERDIIAVLFSENKGRFSALARNGVQSRRFGGSLDLFTASDFELDSHTIRLSEITDERLVQMNSAIAKHSFSSLPKSFEKLSAASCLNDLLMRALPPQKAAPELFKLYSNTLTAIHESPDEQCVALLNGFILKLSQWLGVQPALTRCMKCQKSLAEVSGNSVTPRFQSGGWLCNDCVGNEDRQHQLPTLSKNLMLDAFHALLNPIRKIEWIANTAEHLLLLEFLEQHLMYFVPGMDRTPISSIRFLKSIPWPEQT